jgi:deazaflavin-dependent oxidoreductase (nitroreductase family)
MADMNADVIAEFRANEGKAGGYFQGMPLVLLHAKGAKSGIERISPLVYLPDASDPARIYIFASKGGAPKSPDWYHNVVANPDVTLEVGTEKFDATATELVGAERDTVYAEQSRRYANFADYQKQTERIIPVIALTRK